MSSELVRIRGYIDDANSFVLPAIDGVINKVWDKYQLGMPTRDELDDFALELLGNDDHFVQHDAAELVLNRQIKSESSVDRILNSVSLTPGEKLSKLVDIRRWEDAGKEDEMSQES